MVTRDTLKRWVIDALLAVDGETSVVQIAKHI